MLTCALTDLRQFAPFLTIPRLFHAYVGRVGRLVHRVASAPHHLANVFCTPSILILILILNAAGAVCCVVP